MEGNMYITIKLKEIWREGSGLDYTVSEQGSIAAGPCKRG
jgi:hypothetical protein